MCSPLGLPAGEIFIRPLIHTYASRREIFRSLREVFERCPIGGRQFLPQLLPTGRIHAHDPRRHLSGTVGHSCSGGRCDHGACVESWREFAEQYAQTCAGSHDGHQIPTAILGQEKVGAPPPMARKAIYCSLQTNPPHMPEPIINDLEPHQEPKLLKIAEMSNISKRSQTVAILLPL